MAPAPPQVASCRAEARQQGVCTPPGHPTQGSEMRQRLPLGLFQNREQRAQAPAWQSEARGLGGTCLGHWNSQSISPGTHISHCLNLGCSPPFQDRVGGSRWPQKCKGQPSLSLPNTTSRDADTGLLWTFSPGTRCQARGQATSDLSTSDCESSERSRDSWAPLPCLKASPSRTPDPAERLWSPQPSHTMV